MLWSDSTTRILAFFSPGPFELAVIAGIALLLFGNRLPGAMRNMGRSIVEFKKGVKGIEDDEESRGSANKSEDDKPNQTKDDE